MINLATRETVGLAVVGPEVPLVGGLADAFKRAGILCFGPCARAAQLEGSKAFAKQFMTRHSIPTAKFQVFSMYPIEFEIYSLSLLFFSSFYILFYFILNIVRYEEAVKYVETIQHDVVIKV